MEGQWEVRRKWCASTMNGSTALLPVPLQDPPTSGWTFYRVWIWMEALSLRDVVTMRSFWQTQRSDMGAGDDGVWTPLSSDRTTSMTSFSRPTNLRNGCKGLSTCPPRGYTR